MTVAAAPRTTRDADRAIPAWPATMVRETIAVTATLCGTVPAVLPLAQPGMANTHDGLIHVQRLIALESAIRQGTPFTRWLPDLAYGYGQPLLLYYAPFAYLPGLAARSLGFGYAASVELASGLALVLSALAMYLFARSLFSPLAAVVAAIGYAVLPYQLVDMYVRGALAESWAFVWLPLCAWCLTQAWADGRARWSVGLALSVAGLVLTHNVTALLFLPALVALGLVLHVSTRSRRQAVPIRPIAGLALGLALSAWFWLPALAERQLVQIGETIEPELFASFFVRSWPPFRLDPLYDYQLPVSTALGSPIFWPQLGLVQVVVTVAGVIAAVRTRGGVRGVAIWATALALGGYLMQLRPLAPLYDLIPLLTFVQFPWRLLAVVGLGSAILAGLLVETLSARAAIRAVFAAAIVGASVVTAVATLDPEPLPIDERLLSVETLTRAELADYGLGTTHSGEYLPVSSGQRNAARFRKTLIEAGGGQGGQPDAVPSTLQVEEIDWRPDRIRATVTAPVLERLIVHQFAFPGWAAWVDGSPVPVEAAGQLGLLAVDVPAGQHTVEFAWTWTPLRAAAAGASLVALLLLLPLTGVRPWRPTLGRGVVALVTIGTSVALLVPTCRPVAAVDVAPPSLAFPVAMSEHLSLVSASLDTSELTREGKLLGPPRGVVTSRLVWLVRQPPTTGQRAFVEIIGSDGEVLNRAPWVYEPLSRAWGRGELVQTTVVTELGSPSLINAFQVRLALEGPENVSPVPLGSVTLPFYFDRGSSLLMSRDAVTIGSDVHFWSWWSPFLANYGPMRAKAGSPLDVPLNWAQIGTTPNVERELQVVAVLHVPGGEVVSEPRRPGDWFAPLPFWERGDRIEQNVRLSLPAWVPPGTYPLSVRVYSRDLARAGLSEPGASSARPRGRPVAELALGNVTVEP